MTELEAQISKVLSSIVDPELGVSIFELGMLRDVTVDAGSVRIELALTTIACPLRSRIQEEIRSKVALVDPGLAADFTVIQMNAEQRRRAMSLARARASQAAPNTSIGVGTSVIAIASGKGGVGKSTLTATLGAELARAGYTVGLLDADIWGFSLPRLLGVEARAAASGTAEKWQIEPVKIQVGAGELRVVSMGLLTDDGTSAIMWRGMVLNRAFQHFIEDVDWSDLDYLLIDMPPGTGDVQMGLSRLLPQAGVVVVTTPHDNAREVAVRMVDMARKGNLAVLGVVENMSYFVCEHGVRHYLFGRGATENLCEQAGLRLLAQVPLESQEGVETTNLIERTAAAETAIAGAVSSLAQELVRLAPRADMASCTSRLAALAEQLEA